MRRLFSWVADFEEEDGLVAPPMLLPLLCDDRSGVIAPTTRAPAATAVPSVDATPGRRP